MPVQDCLLHKLLLQSGSLLENIAFFCFYVSSLDVGLGDKTITINNNIMFNKCLL